MLLALSACGGSGSDTTTQTQSSESVTSASESSSSTSEESPSSASPSESGAEGSVQPGEKPVWGIPQQVEGWEVTTFDEQGVNQLRNQDDCRYTTSQNHLGEGYPDDDEEASNAYADQLEKSLGDQMNLGTVDRSTDTVPTGLSNAGPTETVRLDYDYTVDGKDTDYRGILLARAFTEQQGSLYLMYSCPSEAFDEEEFDSLKQKTSVNYVEPSSF